MLSGLRSPQSIGLTNPKEILKFAKQSKLLFQIVYRNNTYIMPFITLIPVTLFYSLNTTVFNTIVYGIPNAILFYLWGYYAWNLLLYQLLYFYLICKYIKIKIRALNEKTYQMIKSKNTTNSLNIIKCFTDIYTEINDYNTIYWSKFLLSLWINFGSFNIIFLFVALFYPVIYFVKIIFIYVTIVFSLLFIFIIFNTSAVNYEAFKSYLILIKYYNLLSQTNRYTNNLAHISIKIKVGLSEGIDFTIIIKIIIIIILLQLLSFIERVSDKRVGFSCYTLFTINYFRCYEVCIHSIYLFVNTY